MALKDRECKKKSLAQYVLKSSSSLTANHVSVAFNCGAATAVRPAAEASPRCVISEAQAERAGQTQALQ